MTLPPSVDFSRITGRFLAVELDNDDSGSDPQGVPITDLTVTVTAQSGGILRPLIRVPASKSVLLARSLTMVSDDEGYLVNPSTRERFIDVVATDDPDLQPTGWTYLVEIRSEADGLAATFSMPAPMGATTDLADVVPVAPQPGEELAAWLAAVNAASVARDEAEAYALDAALARDAAEAARDEVLAILPVVDSQVATAIGTEGSESQAAVAAAALTAADVALDPLLNRTQRRALAGRIVAWLGATSRNWRGDEHLQGTLRRMRIKKTSESAKAMLELSAEGEEPQATAAGLALQMVALYAKHYPEEASNVRPIAERLIATLLGLQCTDVRKPFYGGFISTLGSVIYDGLAAGQAVKGLIAAYSVWGVGQWLEAAKLGGTFLRTLANPNPVYMSLYGVNVIDVPSNVKIICGRIGDNGKLDCTSYAWHLVGAEAMYKLGEVTGDTSWVATAQPIRDFMATALTGYYDYFGTKATAEGKAANLVDPAPILQSTAPAETNAWQRNGEATGKGTIETDSMEYALSALYAMGYDLAALRTAYDFLMSLPQGVIPSTATPAFKAAYNAVNRFRSWPGYFRINDVDAGGASEAWGGYLDVQGAGELLRWKAEQYPEHYLLTLDCIRAIVEPDRGALLKEDLTTLWTADTSAGGGVYAVQGTIPIAVAGIGLLESSHPFDQEVTS